MGRLAEIEHKHDQLRALLRRYDADALWLRRTRNIAWFTAGADASIPADSDVGVYSVLVTARRRIIYTNNIEITRMREEEHFEELGFEYDEAPWHDPRTPGVANAVTDEGDVLEDLIRLRSKLTAAEQTRYRALGRDTAAALEEAIRQAQPGDTEFEIAARLDAAVRKRGGLATVNLIGSDERISKFRHPLATNKRLENYLMMVVCARRAGLVVCATRLAHFGALPAELAEKLQKIATIDAAALVASRPGRALREVFADLRAAYAAQGEADQWRYHHQGGTIAYNARERIATPGDPLVLERGNALAWNPSIVGCKSEDTILLTDSGFEIVTAASGEWPTVVAEVNGQKVLRPGIRVL